MRAVGPDLVPLARWHAQVAARQAELRPGRFAELVRSTRASVASVVAAAPAAKPSAISAPTAMPDLGLGEVLARARFWLGEVGRLAGERQRVTAAAEQALEANDAGQLAVRPAQGGDWVHEVLRLLLDGRHPSAQS